VKENTATNWFLYRKAEHLTGEQMHDEYAWKLWVPNEFVSGILSLAHDSPLASHSGIHKTIERIRRYYSGLDSSELQPRRTCS